MLYTFSPANLARCPVAGAAALVLLAGMQATALGRQSFDPPPDLPILYSDDADDEHAADAIFFLAPWGNLNVTWQTCTEQTPFLTLEQARQQVSAYIAVTGGPQRIQVRIAGGVYNMSQPVIFANTDSGWPDNMHIQYVGWNLINPATGLPSGDDALFSGGIGITGWTQVTVNGVTAYRAQVPAQITEIRDVWVNNFRMVRARFPNIRPCTEAQTSPTHTPCANWGLLQVQNVEALLTPTAERFQRVTVRVVDGSGPIPQPADWSEVEIIGHRTYVNPHQRVGSGEILANGDARLNFPITQWKTPGQPSGHIDEFMDLGAFGPFRWDGWRPENNPPQTQEPYRYTWRFLEVAGYDNQSGSEPGGARAANNQAYMVNSLAFLDDDREWYFDPATNYLYLKICQNPDSVSNPLEVIVPQAEQLLIFDRASHIFFHEVSFGYTHQPMPTQLDGVTPGYATLQGGLQWSDEPSPERFETNNIVEPAVDMIGATDILLGRCRIAHTGGSGVAIRTRSIPAADLYVESHECRVDWCEIFDIGGHAVYIGDEHVRRDLDWPHEPADWRPDPSFHNMVRDCRIHNFALTYKDSVGIYLGHARKTNIVRNEVAWGNWSGMSIGTVRARKWIPSGLPCETGISPQQTEGTSIHNNEIHHVMWRLHDGGGIYMPGSHIPYETAVEFRWSRLLGNYVHDIRLNPHLNYGPRNVNGLYFETGSTNWLVVNNYVERAQRLFYFSHHNRWDGQSCHVMPAIHACPPQPPPANNNRFWMSTWPVLWTETCGGHNFAFPGQVWNAGNPNYWLDVAAGPYDGFDICRGSGGMNTTDALGGPGSLGANIRVTTSNNPNIQAIIANAGPWCDDTICTHSWFFPNTTRRIHRNHFCDEPTLGTPQDYERQMH